MKHHRCSGAVGVSGSILSSWLVFGPRFYWPVGLVLMMVCVRDVTQHYNVQLTKAGRECVNSACFNANPKTPS